MTCSDVVVTWFVTLNRHLPEEDQKKKTENSSDQVLGLRVNNCTGRPEDGTVFSTCPANTLIPRWLHQVTRGFQITALRAYWDQFGAYVGLTWRHRMELSGALVCLDVVCGTQSVVRGVPWVSSVLPSKFLNKALNCYLFAPTNAHIYTGCPRRNVPDFGRVFLMLKYTDITQNTYV